MHRPEDLEDFGNFDQPGFGHSSKPAPANKEFTYEKYVAQKNASPSAWGEIKEGWNEQGAQQREYIAEAKAHGYDPRGAITGPIEVLACICFPPLFLVFGFVWFGRHRKRRFHEYGF